MRKGFTLMEMLLVIALIALLSMTVVSKSGGTRRAGLQAGVRRFAALVRYAYDQSVLTQRVHRVVLNLEEQNWRVEAAKRGQLPVDKAKQVLLADGIREEDVEAITDKAEFEKVGEKSMTAMPKGLQIVEVTAPRFGKSALKKGEVSIYTFPTGVMDESTVVLAEIGKDKIQRFVLEIQPLTGRIKMKTENSNP